MGTPEFAGTNLKALIDGGYNVVLCLCQPDKPVGRKHVLTAPPVKVIAQENGIEVYQPDTLKTDEALAKILLLLQLMVRYCLNRFWIFPNTAASTATEAFFLQEEVLHPFSALSLKAIR